jgi:hypothetical protein
MSMLLLNVFDRSRARDTPASQGSQVDTRYHIVATFEAKENGAGAKSWHLRVVVGGVQRCP